MKKVLLLLCCWLTALGLSAATYPDKIYLIGNINGWDTSTSLAPDEASDGIYTWKNANLKDAGSGDSYFAFTEKQSKDWGGVGTRYGAESKDLAITKDSAKNISTGTENSWKVTAGYYKVVVNLSTKKVTLSEPEGDPDPDPVVNPEIDPDDCYVFFDNSSSNWSQVDVWAWGDENSTASGSWPGDKMTKRSDGLWQWKLPAGKEVPHSIIFNDNKDNNKETGTFTFVNKATYNTSGSQGVNETLEYENITTPDPVEPIEPTYYTIYFDNSTSKWSNVCIYAWTGSNNTGEFRSVEMTQLSGDIYYYDSLVEYENVIFNNGKDGSIQTGNLSWKTGHIYDSSGNDSEYTGGNGGNGGNEGEDNPVVPTRPATLYAHIYTQDGQVGSGEFKGAFAGTAWDANGCTTITVTGKKDDTNSYNLLLSSADSYSNGIDLYGPDAQTALPCSGSKFGERTAHMFWTIVGNANYTITVDWNKQTLSATKQEIGEGGGNEGGDEGGGNEGDETVKYYIYYDGSNFTKPMVWAWNDSGNCVTAGNYDDGDYMTSKDGMWYWEVPEGKSVPTKIIIHGKINNSDVKSVDEKAFVNGAIYHSDGTYTETILTPDDPIISNVQPTGTLPVLYINVYKDADCTMLNNKIIDKDLQHKNYFENAKYWLDTNGCEWMGDIANVGSEDAPLPLSIKARGNFTRKGYSKKPFKLKLDKKQNLLNINRAGEKSKHWALLAHADDQYGYMRNFVGFRLGEMIGLPWTPNQQPIEVVINGNYRGIYFLTESIRVEDGRVPISELADKADNPTDLSGGYLVELDNYADECEFSLTDNSDSGRALNITPDTPEKYSAQQLSFVKEQFTAMNDLINSGTKEWSTESANGLWSYLDLDDAARYYVVEEIISHYEAYHGSTYLYRNKGENEKWHFSPLWDCGHAFDGSTNSYFTSSAPYGNSWIKGLRNKTQFMKKVYDTFQWFINKNESTGKSPYDQLCDEIDAYALNVASAAVADRQRWKDEPTPVDYWHEGEGPQTVVDNTNMTDKADKVKNHLKAKINWLNNQWKSDNREEPQKDNTPAAALPEYVKENYEPETCTIYLIDDQTTKWKEPYVYLYNNDGTNGWPGEAMTYEDNLIVKDEKGTVTGAWTFPVPEAYLTANVVFSNNGASQYPGYGVDVALPGTDVVFHTSDNSFKAPIEIDYVTAWSKSLPLVTISTPSTAKDSDGKIRYIGYGDAGQLKKATLSISAQKTSFQSIEGIDLTIKGRGGEWKESDQQSNSEYKNSFKLKTDKITPFGMSESAHWVLMPYSYDAANGFLTNYAGHEVARLIGMEWTPSMQPVEVVIDGEYMGLYFFAENVRAAAERVPIADYGDKGKNGKKKYYAEHDFLLEFDVDHDENDASELFHSWNYNGFENKLITSTPALGDISTEEEVEQIRGYLTNYMTELQNAVEYAAKNPYSEKWTEVIDAEQAAKYYIVQEIMDDNRSFKNNFYMYHTSETDEAGDVTGSKWFLGPVWDFSGAFSQNGNKTSLIHDDSEYEGGSFIKELYTNKHFKWYVGATFYKFLNGEKMPDNASTQMMIARGARKAASTHEEYDPATTGQFSEVLTSITGMSDTIQDAVEADAVRWPDNAGDTEENSLQKRTEALKDKLIQTEVYLEKSEAEGGAGWNLEDITTGVDDIIVNSSDADAPVEYFDLMGRRVETPQAGSFYIERRGAIVNKIIAK